MRETDESRADLQSEAYDLTQLAANIREVAAVAERGKMTHEAALVRSLMDAMRGHVDRVEAQLLARIPSVRP